MTKSTRTQLWALAIGALTILGFLACYQLTQNRWFLLIGVLGTLPGLGLTITTIDWISDFRKSISTIQRDRLEEEWTKKDIETKRPNKSFEANGST